MSTSAGTTRCGECGKGSSRCHGLCPRCNGRALRGLPMKTDFGRARQAELKAIAESFAEEIRRDQAVQP